MNVKKIVVLGPESTGKSSLCAQLAGHYQTQWVPEFARAYLLQYGSQYTVDNLYSIATGQLASEDAALKQLVAHSLSPDAALPNNDFYPLLIDTDMYVMKVWSEVVFNQCDNRILNAIAQRPYDLYLLCDTDLPWVADELREYPDLHTRQTIFQYYKDAMIQQHVPFVIIRGDYESRFKTAVAAIERLR
jgi:NadR type nicotinamide-nucleotide adenylyltransferase